MGWVFKESSNGHLFFGGFTIAGYLVRHDTKESLNGHQGRDLLLLNTCVWDLLWVLCHHSPLREASSPASHILGPTCQVMYLV